jgi:hypothetical protein
MALDQAAAESIEELAGEGRAAQNHEGALRLGSVLARELANRDRGQPSATVASSLVAVQLCLSPGAPSSFEKGRVT